VTEAVLAALQQWVLFLGTTLVVGCVTWRVFIAPRATILLPFPAGADSALTLIGKRVAVTGLLVTVVLLAAWVLRLVVQVMGFRDPFVPLWDDVSLLLFELFWGAVWMAQGAVLLLLGATFWRLRATPGHDPARVPPLWWAATALALGLVATLALSSHAMGVERAVPVAVTVDGLHALAAGGWIGSLAVILTAGRTPPMSTEPDVAVFTAQIRSFSPIALASGVVLVIMGTALAWTHVQSFANLWGTTYGRLLSAKIGVAALVFAAGFWNWRTGLTISGRPEGAASVRRRAGGEVLLAVGVLLLTAVLVHSTKP
jgi:putative copper export protein